MRTLQIFATQQLWRQQVKAALGDGPLETDATSGFFYIPSCAGAPTGVPETVAGMVPIVWDSVGQQLYAYDGAWLVVGP